MKKIFSKLFMVSILLVSILSGALVLPVYAQEAASVPVQYFDAEGSLMRQDLAILGEAVPLPPEVPELTGQTFAYWYVVDDQLSGDASLAYDFGLPVQGPLNLRALYVPVPTAEATVTDVPASEEQPEVEPAETGSEEDMEPADEECATLVSETEVNTFLVLFYDQDGTLLYELTGIKGSPVEKPEQDPQQEGQIFSHWYLVDEQLEGDALLPYDFERAITGLTYLKAHYLPEQQELPTPEDQENESAVVQDITTEVVVQLAVVLEVAGEQEVQDGTYQALLTGSDLPEEGITVANEGEAFIFPDLVFTAQDEGTHVFWVEALVEEPLPFHTYDQRVQGVQVEIFVAENGHVTALVSYPQEADHLLIAHSVQTDVPTVRVYVNLRPGQTINYGDEVVFTAELEDCGASPRIQWQYSSDNENWQDIAGGEDGRLSIQITPHNAAGYWRAVVTITD